MVKGDIACFDQFLLLSLVFKKLSAAETSERVYRRERVNNFIEPDKFDFWLIKFNLI